MRAPVAQGVHIRKQLPQGERSDGAGATLAGDQLVLVVLEKDEDRIDEALVDDAAGEFLQRVGIEVLPGLPARWRDLGKVQVVGLEGVHWATATGTSSAMAFRVRSAHSPSGAVSRMISRVSAGPTSMQIWQM